MRVNLGWLVVAVLVLGFFAYMFGYGFDSASIGWFLFSGVIGMGLGDFGVYGVLFLLGSRLMVLMIQCLVVLIAVLGEWFWLDTCLSGVQALWGAVILGGVMIVLMLSKVSPFCVCVRLVGFLFGLLVVVGQGFGVFVSRKGVDVAIAVGEVAHNVGFGLNVAYHRIIVGLVFTVVWFFFLRFIGRLMFSLDHSTAILVVRRWIVFWLLVNGLVGPVLGVGCYQWVLVITSSGFVLFIAVITFLIAISLIYWFEGECSFRRSLVGGAVVVVGVVVFMLV